MKKKHFKDLKSKIKSKVTNFFKRQKFKKDLSFYGNNTKYATKLVNVDREIVNGVLKET